jgi:methionine-rich copper-binding protein CopC
MGVTYADKVKQSWEELPDNIEFSGRLEPGDILISKIVTGYNQNSGEVDASIVSDDTISGTKILFIYKGGVDGGTYKIDFRATSAAGAKLEEDFIFSVKDS